jgi:hypothetical protein
MIYLNTISNMISTARRLGISAPTANDLMSDWIARSTAAGVENYSDFSGGSDFVLASTNGGHVFAGGMNPVTLTYVVKDETDGLTNGCCLRIDTPSSVSVNSAAWMMPLSSSFTANSDHFGAGVPFWIQFRFKIPSSRLVLSNTGGNQYGWKFMNIAQYSPTDTDSQSFSNTFAEHVLQDTDQLGIPQAYHRSVSGSFPPFDEFEASVSATLKQNVIDLGGAAGPNRFCYRDPSTGFAATPACVFFPTDEWVTFQVRIKPTTYGGSTGNEFDLWMARRGASSWTHLITESGYEIGDPDSNGGGFAGINGLHLLTYESQRLNSTVDTHQKWDQIIVSLSEIAIPAPI